MAHITSYPAGEAAPEKRYEIGDFILTHRRGPMSRLIQFGQHIRYRGDRRKYAFWSHAALVVSRQGDLVEALAKGVVYTHIDRYKDVEYTYVKTWTTPLDQGQIMRFVKDTVGDKYGWSTDVWLGINQLISTRWSVARQGTSICSGHVARARERAGAYFGCFAADVTPAQLAEYYGASAPS